MPQKVSWLERAKETHKVHVANLRNNDGWTVAMTAKVLSRSSGSISQDLMIARWYRTHAMKLDRMHTLTEALEFIRSKEKEMEIGD